MRADHAVAKDDLPQMEARENTLDINKQAGPGAGLEMNCAECSFGRIASIFHDPLYQGALVWQFGYGRVHRVMPVTLQDVTNDGEALVLVRKWRFRRQRPHQSRLPGCRTPRYGHVF